MLKNDKNEDLPPINTYKRYNTSIPQGRISQHSPTEVPVIASRKGSLLRKQNQPFSARDVVTDPSIIDKKLKSISQHNISNDFRISLETEKKQKANLKFLKYKFNPGDNEQQENFDKNDSETYGQLRNGKQQKISINTFYEHKNVLFQDQRAPLIYKKLFLEKTELH